MQPYLYHSSTKKHLEEGGLDGHCVFFSPPPSLFMCSVLETWRLWPRSPLPACVLVASYQLLGFFLAREQFRNCLLASRIPPFRYVRVCLCEKGRGSHFAQVGMHCTFPFLHRAGEASSRRRASEER